MRHVVYIFDLSMTLTYMWVAEESLVSFTHSFYLVCMVVNFAAVDIHEKLNCTVLITYWVLISNPELIEMQGLYTMPIFQY